MPEPVGSVPVSAADAVTAAATGRGGAAGAPAVTGSPPAAGRDGRESRFVLAVDLGTGGPKVGLVSLAGRIATSEHLLVDTVDGPDGEATQDASAWWELVVASARRALASGAVDPDRVVAVSCTGQWASTVPVDVGGQPTGPCLLWRDTRGGPLVRSRVGGPVAGYDPRAALRWVRRSGGAPSTSGADPIGHILYLEAAEPEQSARTRWYLEPVDYLSMRFTGAAAATPASMSGAWLTDNRRNDEVDYDPVLVRAAGVPPHKLPPLRPSGSVLATVAPGVAARLGLRPDTVVVAGTPDLHSACVGSGAVARHRAHIALSTTSWVSCPHPGKKTDPFRQIATVPGILPGLRLVADNQDSAGVTLEWLRDVLDDRVSGGTGGGRAGGGAGDRAPLGLDEVTALAATAAPGSGGLLFTPWMAGERSPVDDRDARGGFHNLSLRTTRAEVARSVLEGVAFNSRWLLGAVERFVGERFPSVRMVGGGATSPLWCSIFADVLDRPVEQVAEPRLANLRGAALIAGLALGAVGVDEVESLVPVERTYRPDPANRSTYDRLAAELPRLYRAQRGTFGRLNRRRPGRG